MNILIVEDDTFKADALKEYVLEIVPNANITVAKSFRSGCHAAFEGKYEILLLDMTMPNFDVANSENGGDTLKNGGELIMRELLDEAVPFKAVIISQYETFNNETIEQIDARLKELCSSNYLGWIKYSTKNIDWKEKLNKLISDVINTSN